MGAYIDFANHITIANKSSNGFISQIGYKDINDKVINEILNNKRIKWIQISNYLPDEAYQVIDNVLSVRKDLTFRLFHFMDNDTVDISFLLEMPHLERLQIDCIDFKSNPERIDFDVLTKLNLKSLHLECFDLKNYEFIKNLSDELEEISIMADTMGSGVKFDCSWLLKYKYLNSLWLGKKAKKNLESISELPNIKSLSLRGIKISDFSFLLQMNLDKLALLWNSNADLHELSKMKSLKEIELWRINKLSDISFIKDLINLEVIKLMDLNHVTSIPDLREHKNLQRIFLINTGIDIKSLPKYLQKKVSNWDDR